MCVYVRFIVRPESVAAFVSAWGHEGERVRWCRDSRSIGTDRCNPLRFVTIDRWTSREASAEFEQIDTRGASFTQSETLPGEFEAVS